MDLYLCDVDLLVEPMLILRISFVGHTFGDSGTYFTPSCDEIMASVDRPSPVVDHHHGLEVSPR